MWGCLLTPLRTTGLHRNNNSSFSPPSTLFSSRTLPVIYISKLVPINISEDRRPNARTRFRPPGLLFGLVSVYLPSPPPPPHARVPTKRERNLLGTAYDWESNARPASFDDVQRRHHALPANQLARVTAQYLRQQHEAAAAGSSSGTAIEVTEERPPSTTGPAVSRSLLSRVESFGHDREANEVFISHTYIIPLTSWKFLCSTALYVVSNTYQSVFLFFSNRCRFVCLSLLNMLCVQPSNSNSVRNLETFFFFLFS